MQSSSVLLLQGDSRIARSIVACLRNSFTSVREERSMGELRNSLAKHRATVAILDMELASISDVENLSHDFPEVCVVCTHRLADEAMWSSALNAGAADVCPSHDTRAILDTALRGVSKARSFAA